MELLHVDLLRCVSAGRGSPPETLLTRMRHGRTKLLQDGGMRC